MRCFSRGHNHSMNTKRLDDSSSRQAGGGNPSAFAGQFVFWDYTCILDMQYVYSCRLDSERQARERGARERAIATLAQLLQPGLGVADGCAESTAGHQRLFLRAAGGEEVAPELPRVLVVRLAPAHEVDEVAGELKVALGLRLAGAVEDRRGP